MELRKVGLQMKEKITDYRLSLPYGTLGIIKINECQELIDEIRTMIQIAPRMINEKFAEANHALDFVQSYLVEIMVEDQMRKDEDKNSSGDKNYILGRLIRTDIIPSDFPPTENE